MFELEVDISEEFMEKNSPYRLTDGDFKLEIEY